MVNLNPCGKEITNNPDFNVIIFGYTAGGNKNLNPFVSDLRFVADWYLKPTKEQPCH